MQLTNVAKLISIIAVLVALPLYFNVSFRTEYYLFLHALFGFGAPWIVSVFFVYFDGIEISLSFKLGLVATGLMSIYNEYIYDYNNNAIWVFAEQFQQTLCDAFGMFLAFILMIYLRKTHKEK